MAKRRKVKEVEKPVESEVKETLDGVNEGVNKDNEGVNEGVNKNNDGEAEIPLQQPNTNNPVVEELFKINIAEYGVKFKDAQEFINNVFKFYQENKDKVFITIEDVPSSDDKINEIKDKIKNFESSLFKFTYLPKSMVTDFINDLKNKIK
jgi:hypothetical protein